MRCRHGQQKRDCKKCKHADDMKYYYREKMAAARELWTCPNCGKSHNTHLDVVCYFCFTPRSKRCQSQPNTLPQSSYTSPQSPRVIVCPLCGQETAVRTERVTVNGLPYNVYYCAPCNVTIEVKESE